MRQAWNALTWAVATLSDGRVECAAGIRTADEFARSAELPPGLVPDVSS
jgi:hypothetical protein